MMTDSTILTVNKLIAELQKAVEQGYGNLPVALVLEDGSTFPVREGFYDIGEIPDGVDTVEGVLMGG